MATQLLLDKEIAVLLGDQNFTDDDAQVATVRAGIEPATPDFTISVLLESGFPPTKQIGERNSFTVRVRHSKAEEANEQMRSVFKFLQEFSGRAGAIPVGRITANAGPVQLGRDEAPGRGQGRWVVSQTFTAITDQF
ncbi:MAG: hypothetical protein GY778_28855 [bacterium]|nr:hypothetical protein [bacterium]